MARQRLENKSIRKLIKLGKGSVAVTLPIDLVRGLKWRVKQKVVVKKRGSKLTIEDWPALRRGKPALKRGRKK